MLLNGHVVKLLSKYYVYRATLNLDQRIFCSVQQLMQGSKCWALNGISTSVSLSQGSGTPEKEGKPENGEEYCEMLAGHDN